MELEFEAINGVKFGEERCWTASYEGHEGFQEREEQKGWSKDREECERKRSWEESCDADTFLWLVHKSHKNDLCLFFPIDSEEGVSSDSDDDSRKK